MTFDQWLSSQNLTIDEDTHRLLAQAWDASAVQFAREVELATNEGRGAARTKMERTQNPYNYSSAQSAAKRVAWDAGWLYMAGRF